MTLVLCLVICIAVARTRKTPYPSRILCIGLLSYNCLFLPCASASKLFPHEESFPLRHLSRGFQIAAQFMVAFMAFERYFVLKLALPLPHNTKTPGTKDRSRDHSNGLHLIFARKRNQLLRETSDPGLPRRHLFYWAVFIDLGLFVCRFHSDLHRHTTKGSRR